MSTSPENLPPPADPLAPNPSPNLGFWEKFVLGMGGLPVFYGSYMVQNFAIAVYQMTLAVNPALLGLALAVPRLWDAFIDPAMGNISDNFRSRFGRRKPFIVVGALLMGLSFGLIWMVPPAWGQWAKLGYFVVTALFFYTCYAVFCIPYQSLTYEATPDYDERTRVMAHYSVWYKFGDLSYSWVFWLAQLSVFGSLMGGVHAVGWIVGILIFGVIAMMPGIFAKERYYKAASHQTKVHFWRGLRDALANKALLNVIGLTMLKLVPSMLASSMDFYLLVYYMFHGNKEPGSYWKAILSSSYGVVGLISIPILAMFCTRFGKKWAMFAVYGLVVFAGIAKWFLFVPGNTWIILLDAVLSAPIWTGISMVIPSMIADVCDDDELHHGQRREGTYGAIYNWIVKVSISLAFLCTGILLNLVGFNSTLGGAQSEHTFFWMRFSFAGVTAVSGIFGMIVAVLYPISKTKAEHTRRQLEDRRGRI